MIVNQRNPKATKVHHIKETTTVVVLLSGPKVPNYVTCGTSMLRCALYRSQTAVCYECVALGYCAGVCPTPTKKVYRECSVNNLANDHRCQTTCALCGGGTSNGQQVLPALIPSLLLDKATKTASKGRQETQAAPRGSHITGFERSINLEDAISLASCLEQSQPLKRMLLLQEARSLKGHSHCKGCSSSRLRFQEAPKTCANCVKPCPVQHPAQVTHAALPDQKEHPRIAFLLQESARLKAQLQQMRVEFEALENTAKAPARSSLVEPQPAKRNIGTEGEMASDLDILGGKRDFKRVPA
ncbi:hypothetical protein HPB51_028837 [Rhipicephalus microplus]|uniref:Uncharacterized protein n=1 Tax=Rhipicephalus microplus TaxID=6941 RepID=A0A9J6CW81_RHIMP|nr:hypothetical protein HPB51_028837 [Rhipicephalus microplus]